MGDKGLDRAAGLTALEQLGSELQRKLKVWMHFLARDIGEGKLAGFAEVAALSEAFQSLHAAKVRAAMSTLAGDNADGAEQCSRHYESLAFQEGREHERGVVADRKG